MTESLMGHQCISNLCLLLYFYQLKQQKVRISHQMNIDSLKSLKQKGQYDETDFPISK